MTDQYQWWQDAVSGKNPPVHDGEPQAGFFYMRTKTDAGEGRRLPVAIWPDEMNRDGSLICASYPAGTEPKMLDPVTVWTFVCQHPISEEIFRQAVDHGTWPDDAPAKVNHDQLYDDPVEALKATLRDEWRGVADFLKKPIEDEATADKAADWARRLVETAKYAVDQHKQEKAPILEAGRAVDKKWFELRDIAQDLAAKVKSHMEPWLRRQKQLDRERQEKERAEAEKLREEAAKVNDPDTQADLLSKAQEADKAASAERKASAGRTGRKVGLRKEKYAIVKDWKVLASALIEAKDGDLHSLLQKKADAAARGGNPLPGTEGAEREKVQ